MAVGLAFLLAWAGWFLLAGVSVYVASEEARLEADRAVYYIDAPVSGRVVGVNGQMDQAVQVGDVLFELDAEAERLALAEAEARQATLRQQHLALAREQDVVSRALRSSQQAGSAALQEAEARYDEALAAAQLAAAEVERLRQLYDKQLVAAAEYERAQTEAVQKRAAAAAIAQSLSRLDYDRQTESGDRRVVLDQGRREAVRLAGELAIATATIDRLTHEIARRQVRAPVPGTLGEVADLRVGSFVQEGQRLGAVVPQGALRTVAYFAPSDAVGRIRPGQRAQLRLDGFPWTQYGTVPVTVARVAREGQDGRLRVELAVVPGGNTRIPLQHGLPGTLEVEVERLSPAALVLRHVGKWLN